MIAAHPASGSRLLRGGRLRSLALAAWVSAGPLGGVSAANEHVGLWVGTATVTGVSQVHKATPDLAFDLSLTGLKTTAPLLPFKSGGWEYNKADSFEDEAWTTGTDEGAHWTGGQPAPLYAAPQGPEDSQGTQMGGDGDAAYFRRTVPVADPSAYAGLRLRLRVEDGAAVYLNGRSVYRHNLPTGALEADTLASADIARQGRLVEATLPATALVAGDNVIAVEVHAFQPGQRTLFFDLELAGTALMVEETLVASEASGWVYAAPENPAYATDPQDREPYQAPAGDWTTVDYVPGASAWTQGTAKFGFGNSGESPNIGFNTAIWPRTIYFRYVFTPSSIDFDQLRLELLRDDGAVVYLNGAEIVRSNMPSGLIAYETPPVQAVGPSDEGRYLVEEREGLELLPGENVLAVEIHQHPSELGDPGEEQTAVTPSPANFALRFMLHNDAGGAVRLLKEVYGMVNQDGENVLLSSDELIPNHEGQGNRISTAAYDFEGDAVFCGTGAVSNAGTVECTIVLPANHPTNPFLHRYHPDHDNWDSRYEKHFPETEGAPEESFEVTRTIKLSFEEKYPPGCQGEACRQYPPPSWGYSSLGGSYEETFTGLHRNPITVTGTFRLDRVSTVEKLEE